jgi:D-lactate dehydrogenase
MKIAFLEVENWEKKYLKKIFPTAQFFDSVLTVQKIKKMQDVEIISPFIYSELTAEKLALLPNLKLIATRSTGFDHIDVAFCKQKNIAIAYVPVYGENTVAEHTFALLLALSRKLIPSVERAKSGDFNLAGLRGFDLAGKTIGIIGTGNIGAHVARIASGFGMKVLGFDLNRNEDLVKKYNLRYTNTLVELVSNSDIITLHLPLNEHTHHIIDKGILNQTKRGAYLINTARGGLVDDEALLWALESNILAGVGLDVLEEEPLIREERELLHHRFNSAEMKDYICENILLRHPKVIVTPHNAFNSKEALKRILDTTAANIQNFIKGQAQNLVK